MLLRKSNRRISLLLFSIFPPCSANSSYYLTPCSNFFFPENGGIIIKDWAKDKKVNNVLSARGGVCVLFILVLCYVTLPQVCFVHDTKSHFTWFNASWLRQSHGRKRGMECIYTRAQKKLSWKGFFCLRNVHMWIEKKQQREKGTPWFHATVCRALINSVASSSKQYHIFSVFSGFMLFVLWWWHFIVLSWRRSGSGERSNEFAVWKGNKPRFLLPKHVMMEMLFAHPLLNPLRHLGRTLSDMWLFLRSS